MQNKYRWWLLLFVFLVGSKIFFIHHARQPADGKSQMTIVDAINVSLSNWHQTIDAVGTVSAAKSIVLRSEASGIISKIYFNSNQVVSAGQLLLEIRSDTIKADLTISKIELSNDIKNYERRKALLPKHYIAEADVDNVRAAVERDKEEIKKQEALIAQRVVVAPFAGDIGIKMLEEGEYVSAGQAIANLEMTDPVYVDFYISEKMFNQIKLNQSVDVIPNSELTQKYSGKIVAIDNKLDDATRSIKVRAEISNPKKQLLTGMSVNIVVNESSQLHIILPQSAINYSPDGVGVYVIDKNSVVHWRPITTGVREKNDVVILSGLKPHELVVTSGQSKIREGFLVRVAHHESEFNHV